jgi:hypothetical protein
MRSTYGLPAPFGDRDGSRGVTQLLERLHPRRLDETGDERSRLLLSRGQAGGRSGSIR